MNFLQKPVGAVAGFVNRRHGANHRVKHSVIVLLDADGLPAFASFDDDLDLPVFLTLCLQDTPESSDIINLIGVRFVNRRVVLGGEKNISVARHRPFQSLHRTRTTDLKGNLCVWKNDDIADRHHRITL